MNTDEIVKALQERFDKITGAYEVMSALAEARKEEIESLATQLAELQRRADAAVEDLYRIAACDACKHYDPDENACAKPMVESYKCFEWRGPDEKGETHE